MCAQAAGGSGAAQEPEPAQPRWFDRAGRGSKRRTRKLGAADGAAARRLGGRDAAHRQGMIVTLVGVWLANEVVHLLQVAPYRWRCRATWAASWPPPRQVPPRQPLADTSACPTADSASSARRRLAVSSANRPASAAALRALVGSVSFAHHSAREALGLARRGAVSCPHGVHSDFASPQSAQPSEQLATAMRQLGRAFKTRRICTASNSSMGV